jgi:hypothetical protein
MLNVERENIRNESESHSDPPQVSTSQGLSVAENSEVDQISNEDPISSQQVGGFLSWHRRLVIHDHILLHQTDAPCASVRESSDDDLSYISDISYQSPTPSAWSESSRQVCPLHAERHRF